MTNYEKEAIGTIIIVKNIIFPNTNKKELDHSWKKGRPCLIIYSDAEYDYILPMTSKPKDNYEKQHYTISQSDLLYTYIVTHQYNSNYKQKQIPKGAIKLSTVYKIPQTGHDERSKIALDTLKKIIEKLKEYHQTDNIESLIEKSAKIKGGR